MKVLILDDELAIREALGRKLQREGFEVVLCANGEAAMEAFHSEHPDLVVLDIVMPGEINGLGVCERIRQVAETPVMMLSAQAITESDIIQGLNVGADEYLVKPVRLNEFVARIRALLRRAHTATTDTAAAYDDGFLIVDLHHRRVSVDQKKVHLTPTEFKLLVMLIANQGRVVSQRELLEHVWGPEYVDDIYYPRVYVSQLRRKIEPDPSNPTYIQTEHRIGYRFESQT